MEKLERVQRMTYRRMGQVDSELERFEERPELDSGGRYGSLLKRFEELEKLYYNLAAQTGAWSVSVDRTDFGRAVNPNDYAARRR